MGASPHDAGGHGIDPAGLDALNAAWPPPLLIDARRGPVYAAADVTLPGSVRRDPEAVASWAGDLEPLRPIVVACVHGHAVSQGTAVALRERGLAGARHLEGGVEGWAALGRPLVPKRPPTLWVTRERPKVDRIACPWLIRRFLDPDARILFVPPGDVLRVAAETGATPFDVPDVTLTHRGPGCSFDAFLEDHSAPAADPALRRLADIVRGADTDRFDLAPEAAGLFAISLGLSAIGHGDDAATLRQGLVIYDALYAWLRDLQGERHSWPPATPAPAGAAP